MITLLDLRTACNRLLKAHYPTIPTKSQDIEKGFARPSFTTMFDNVEPATLESSIEVKMDVTIYYFPDLKMDDYFLHLDDVKFNLPIIFGNKFKVLHRYLDVNEPVAKVVDGIIVFEFSLHYYDDTPMTENEEEIQAMLMQELDFKFK